MRIIITGGTGLIGKPLTASLLAAGHDVIVLSRNPSKHDMPEGTRLHKWDATSSTSWQMLVDETDAIINLAAASIAGDGALPSRWTDERKELILQSRLNAGQAVVEAFQKAENKPHTLIQASASGYYGTNKSDKVHTEEDDPGSDFLARVCVEWERVTDPVAEMDGVRRCIIRTGLVMSNEGGAFPYLVLPFRFVIAGGPLGDGSQYYPWIHIDDVVRAIEWLVENDEAEGPYNLSAPTPHPQREIAKAIGAELNRPAFFPTPGFAMRLALGEVSDTVLKGQRSIPKKLTDEGFTFKYPTIEQALDDLL